MIALVRLLLNSLHVAGKEGLYNRKERIQLFYADFFLDRILLFYGLMVKYKPLKTVRNL